MAKSLRLFYEGWEWDGKVGSHLVDGIGRKNTIFWRYGKGRGTIFRRYGKLLYGSTGRVGNKSGKQSEL